MKETIKKFIRDLFTEDDGKSWCFAKVTAAVMMVSYLGNVTYSIYAGHAPDLAAFGAGLRDVMLGAGLLIAGKQATQKEQKPDHD